MVTAGYITKFAFGGLGLIPASRHARVTETGITWNYTTILNIIFLLAAAALVTRFFRSGAGPMLKMMGGAPAAANPDNTRHHAEHQAAGRLAQNTARYPPNGDRHGHLRLAHHHLVIQPMRHLPVRQGLKLAAKADFLALSAFEIGVFGARQATGIEVSAGW